MSILHKKAIAELQSESESNTLRRALGPLNLTTLGIGSIIGTGIFVLTGTAASQNAGPGLVFSMLISAAGCAYSPARPFITPTRRLRRSVLTTSTS